MLLSLASNFAQWSLEYGRNSRNSTVAQKAFFPIDSHYKRDVCKSCWQDAFNCKNCQLLLLL